VEGDKHNFVSLKVYEVDLCLASELCQTIGDEFLFYLEQLQQFGKST
jgi:hypothetical protein